MAAGPVPVTEAFQKVTGAVRSHEVTVVNGLVIAVTVSGEELFRKVAFNCPCSQPSGQLYGGAFIYGPAFVLFLFGLLINNVTWRLAHGCLHRSRATRHGFRRGFGYVVAIVGRALVAPSAWIFISLLDGSYYMCMVSMFPCETNSTTNDMLKAHSQTLAWMYLSVAVSIILTVLCAVRCSDKFTYVQSKYIEAYQELELSKFEEVMRDRAGRLAERNVAEFFDKDVRMKEDWDAVSVAPLCDVHWVKKPKALIYKFKFGGNFPEPYFSPLHKWANDHRRNRPISDDEQMELIGLQMAPPMPTQGASPPLYSLPPSHLPPKEFWHDQPLSSAEAASSLEEYQAARPLLKGSNKKPVLHAGSSQSLPYIDAEPSDLPPERNRT